jgi:hypothetical protein
MSPPEAGAALAARLSGAAIIGGNGLLFNPARRLSGSLGASMEW